MRISDWSSDVCSSDLERFGQKAGDKLPRAVAARGCSPGDGTEHPDPHHVPPSMISSRPSSARSPSAGEAGSPSAIVESSGRKPVTSTGSGRSEEHTSELQSLMRTSYAVLCLKTKNHRTIARSDHKEAQIRTTLDTTKLK